MILCYAVLLQSQQAVLAGEHRIVPGDHVALVSSKEPALCVERVVQADGTISVPGLGLVTIASRTSTSATEKIRQLLDLGGLYRGDSLTIRFQPVTSGTVEVVGAVQRPLVTSSSRSLSLRELLRASGVTSSGDQRAIEIDGADGLVWVVDAELRDYLVRPGDRVTINRISGPTGVTVLGGVLRPSSVDFTPAMTLKDALAKAGGISPHGNVNRIILTRGADTIPLQMPLDEGFRLRVGDSVNVSVRSDRGYVMVVGSVMRPGLVEFAPGLTLTEAIAAAGGPDSGFSGDTVVLRTRVDNREKVFHLSLAFIKEKRIPDPILRADDTVEVVNTKG